MADVVEYSCLMATDEEGTIAQLKANRKELIEPKETKHKGRTFKLMGDGAFMGFRLVTNALNQQPVITPDRIDQRSSP